MIVLDVNPYIWDASSENLTSPFTLDVSVKTSNNTELSIEDLGEPLNLQLPTGC